MDLKPHEDPEAATSSNSLTHLTTQQELSQSHSEATSSSEPRTLRSSARVKAAKLKEKERNTADQPSSSASTLDTSASRTTRANTLSKLKRQVDSIAGKGKDIQEEVESLNRSSKRPRRSTNPSSAALTIREPSRDTKGKKRAAPEPTSEEDETATATSSSNPHKRARTSYSLRSQTNQALFQSIDMTRNSRSSGSKVKMGVKSKAMASTSSSRLEDDDVDMPTEYKQEEPDHVDSALEAPDARDNHEDEDDCKDLGEDEGEGEGVDDDDDDDENVPVSAPGSGSLDESAAMAIFGDYRQFGSYMMTLSSRLKTMLNNIKTTADPTTRLVTLQELSELLSISTEDTLAGSFQVESFVRELVKILGGRGVSDDEDDGENDHDEDSDLAAALAMSDGAGQYQGDENLEAQVLACRCLANLMEALPGVAHTVVYHGAIPVLCSKLIEISYIDLAEQTLSTLEKISEEFPSAIVREGGLAALLNYLDFFSIAVQRTALQAASNCCRNISSEHFPMISGAWPIIRNCLSYSDQRLVEFACLCVIRVVDSYHRSCIEHLEALVNMDLVKAVNILLLPAGGSPLIATNTYTALLRALATSARSSPKITLTLLEADIVDTLYQILTGVLPSASQGNAEQGGASDGQGLGGGLADMTVMENLAHRPKEQVEEALSLASELMPPLPKDGVFDHKNYTEKALARMVKARGKAERASARQAAALAAGLSSIPPASSGAPSGSHDSINVDPPAQSGATQDEDSVAHPSQKDSTSDRTDLLRSKPIVVERFMQLMVPILIDVYAASVITPIRMKSLTGLLKAVGFLDAQALKRILTSVPVASFASSILSSKDHPSLIIGALQLVDLLLAKLPTEYKASFRREGVFHEIESIANRPVSFPKSKDKDKEPMDTPSPADIGSFAPHASSSAIAGLKKLSSLALDPEDAITMRSRVIRFKYLLGSDSASHDNTSEVLCRLVQRISSTSLSEKEATQVLKEIACLFASARTSISSFELLQSGLVDSLLQFATEKERDVTVERRKELLFDAFTSQKINDGTSNQTSFSIFVKKLQESLTRMETFDVITVAQSSDDSKRSSPSLLARQLRLRLVAADESDIPHNLHNIVVSIHAIATFQALHDYLRPRVSGIISAGSRLSGMLAALAASAHAPASSSRTAVDDVRSATVASLMEPGSLSTPAGGAKRRRSLRLSAKNATNSVNPADTTSSADAAQNSGHQENTNTPAEATSPDRLIFGNLTAAGTSTATTTGDSIIPDFGEEDIDDEVVEDEIDPDNSISEKTVTLSVADDGSKIEAQTPDGTRVATPSSNMQVSSSNRHPSSVRSSYAAALKAKPADWHLQFSMDDHILPLDLTIYGAIHQHEMRKKSGPLPSNLFWQGIYTVKFKKVVGPSTSSDQTSDTLSKTRPASPPLSSLPDDAPHTKILRLLRVLHKLNVADIAYTSFDKERQLLPESAFVNNKLTAKLTRQLEEPMIVASSCLPDWALDLPQHFPFLFPFATRYNFLQSTSFGYARLILKWQSQQSRGQDTSRRDDGIGFLGRLQRQKVRISRKHILESAVKVFELYGSSSSILEVEYFEEVGTGLGPTLEFYSLVSKEFARRDLKIWRDEDETRSGVYVHHPHGLFPAPIAPDDIANDGGQKRTHIFRVIGQFVAKAMLDSRIIDLSFNKIFVKLILDQEVPLTIAHLKLVDVELGNSLARLLPLAPSQNHSAHDKFLRKVALAEHVSIEDLALDFTIPGYDIELRPGGRDIAVTEDNVEEYIREVIDAIIGQGARRQAKAFREGFSKVFPISDLQAFSSEELVLLFGNGDEDWSTETLGEALKADHGFNVESRAIRDLIDVMAEYDAQTRREYLQFITGSPKLPIGGFRGLNPPLTVVRKPHEPPLLADDYLPSVMTCVNYLKLPDYSSKDVMREKLRVAMKEGVGSFHLS